MQSQYEKMPLNAASPEIMLNQVKIPLTEYEPIITPHKEMQNIQAGWSPFAFRKLSSPMNFPLMQFNPFAGVTHSPAQSPQGQYMLNRSPTLAMPGYSDFTTAFDVHVPSTQGIGHNEMPINYIRPDAKKP